MSGHYGCAAVPARARRPRDKASVEMGVGLIERQAMLALRGRRFMSLEELNAALADQVAAINSRPSRARNGSSSARSTIHIDGAESMRKRMMGLG